MKKKLSVNSHLPQLDTEQAKRFLSIAFGFGAGNFDKVLEQITNEIKKSVGEGKVAHVQ